LNFIGFNLLNLGTTSGCVTCLDTQLELIPGLIDIKIHARASC